MISLLPLLVAATLLQCVVAFVHIDDTRLEPDNNLLPNDIPIRQRRVVGKYVKISTPPPATVRYEPGTNLILQCDIMGNPAPVAEWMQNGVPVSDIEEDANEILSLASFSPAQLSSKYVVNGASDGDVFTCVARSGLREDSASTTVIVEGDSSEASLSQLKRSKPIITDIFNDLVQIMGTSVTLPCRVYSPTKYQIFWQDNSEKLIYGNNRIKVLPSGDLHIADLSWGDMGGWTCSVKNAYGKDVATTFLYPLLAR